MLKINKNYTLREVAGEKVIVQQGKAGINMTKIISLNPSAEFPIFDSSTPKKYSLTN